MTSFLSVFLRQSVALNIAFVGLVMYGAFVAIPSLPVDRYPNFAFGEAQVTTVYPGARAGDVERDVTRPLEDAIRGMEQVEWVSSVSVYGQSEILVKFLDDHDYEALYDEFRFRILGAQNQLPTVDGDPLQPQFQEIDTDSWLPVLQVNLRMESAQEKGSSLSASFPESQSAEEREVERRLLVRLARDLRDRVGRVSGVKRVDLLGDLAQQFLVSLDPDRLIRYRVSYQDVVQAIRASGASLPAGTVETRLGERTIRVDTRYRERQDVLDVVVRREGDGSVLTVADVVDLEATGVRRLDTVVLNSINGRPAVSLKILKEPDANALSLCDTVRSEVAVWREQIVEEPVDVVYTLDSTTKINDSMAVLYDSFLLAIALVVSTLFFFLTNRRRSFSVVTAILCLVAVVVIASTQATRWEALSLAALCLFVFVTCRSAVLTVSGIVFSFLGTLVAFSIAGQSLNEITLLGFVLTVGIIVDDAIIVLENIQRHREHGASAWRAAIDGVSEVFWPVVSATLTTCAAFLPMLLMTGSTGDFFALLPISVATALAISLVECLIVLPLHSLDLERWFGREKNVGGVTAGSESDADTKGAMSGGAVDPMAVTADPILMTADQELSALLSRPGFVGRLARGYDRVLSWNLRHPVWASGFSVVAFLLALGVILQSVVGPKYGQAPILRLKFFPEDTSILNVTARLPSGSPLTRTNEVVEEVSRKLLTRGSGEIKSCSGIAGLTVDSTYRPVWNRQYGFVFVELPSREDQTYTRVDDLMESIRVELAQSYADEGIEFQVTAQKDGPPTGAPLSLRATGSNSESVRRLSSDLYQWIEASAVSGGELEGVIELNRDDRWTTTEIEFKPDPRRVAQHGLTVSEVQQFVAGAFDGTYAADYLRRDDEIPVRVRITREALSDPERLLGLALRQEATLGEVRFGDLGEMGTHEYPASLRRREYQRAVTITGNLAADAVLSPSHLNERARVWFAERANEYPGAALDFGGEAEHTAKSFRSLFVAFGLAVFLIYLILAAQFQSYQQPLIILSNVIFSFTGVVLTLAGLSIATGFLPDGWLRPERSMITITSFIAVVGLTGIVVNDAIVLVDFVNRQRARGRSVTEAVRLAGHQRMRPILMTTISTIAGLVPMAIGIPHFSISWSPFATCFVSGLVVATGMTLIIVPVFYRLMIRESHDPDDPDSGAPDVADKISVSGSGPPPGV